MTRLSALQVAGLWVNAGGPANRAVEWVAIALGESDYEETVVSPAGAIGPWQIMPFNAAPYGFTVQQLFDPRVNARVAVLMSGGGTNCAAWDSCYTDINASGRYRFLAYPEAGSVDYRNIAIVQAELAGHGLPAPSNPGNPGVDDTLTASVATWQQLAGQSVPALTIQVAATAGAISASFKRGWKP